MFDPKIGRWMSQDPIELDAGDTNLYRYVRNNPTDATDPTGQIAIWDLKASFRDRALGLITYDQVHGAPADIIVGTGSWSQPPSAGEGSSKQLNGDYKFGGIQSTIKITGKGQEGGVCNTVWDTAPDPVLKDAGSIRAKFSEFKPGLYEVKYRYKISFNVSPEGNVGGNATVRENQSGSMTQIGGDELDSPNRNRPGRTPGATIGNGYGGEERTTTVRVDDRGRAVLAIIDVRISGKEGWCKAWLELGILDIKRLDEKPAGTVDQK